MRLDVDGRAAFAGTGGGGPPPPAPPRPPSPPGAGGGPAGRRVASLALRGVAARMAVHPELLAAAAAGRHLAPELVASWGFGRAGHFGGNPAPGLWMVGGALRP